jgi:hypothetical protein
MTVSTEDDRHTGWVFTLCYALIYLAAPCLHWRRSGRTLRQARREREVANPPASTYMLGQIAPLFCSWLGAPRLERSIVVWADFATGFLILLVAAALALRLPAAIQIAAVAMQGLLQGLSAATSQVFVL